MKVENLGKMDLSKKVNKSLDGLINIFLLGEEGIFASFFLLYIKIDDEELLLIYEQIGILLRNLLTLFLTLYIKWNSIWLYVKFKILIIFIIENCFYNKLIF